MTAVSTRIIPYADRVLIEPIESASMTPGGLHIPDNARERSRSGRVESIGAEITDIHRDDEVLFEKFSGVDIAIEGKQFKILRRHEILAVKPRTY